jgi:RNA polymerase sigma-70 factor (ECF subfamily)
MTAPTPNHELIRRAQAADPQALSAIYERYAPGIFRYVYYRVGDADLAHDIQSDVFLRMLEGITRYEDRGWSIGSWLYRIAHARTIDNLRRRERHPQTPLDDWDGPIEEPDDSFEGSHRQLALRHAMNGLCESQRRVLFLRHVHGLSLEETARQMGRTVGSIKALQHRAHERVIRLMQELPGED